MSKSFGNVIDPIDLINEFGSDAVRYYFVKESNYDSDMVFSRDLFIGVYNNDLANIYGNLVSRFCGMAKKYANNEIEATDHKNADELTKALNEKRAALLEEIGLLVDAFALNELLHKILDFGKATNKYIEEFKP
jgi:methionyl-tRNA synthetase